MTNALGLPHRRQEHQLTSDDTSPGPNPTALVQTLAHLTAALRQTEPEAASELVAKVLGKDGILDHVLELTDAIRQLVEDRAEEEGIRLSTYRVWHGLCDISDALQNHSNDRHAAHLLFGNPVVHPRKPVEAPEPWIGPAAVLDMPAALDAIGRMLDSSALPFSAAIMLAPVFDPDGGVLDRLSHLLASASRYAHEHGAPDQLSQDLAHASQDLDRWAGALGRAKEQLTAQPRRRPRPTHGNPSRPTQALPPSGNVSAGRGR